MTDTYRIVDARGRLVAVTHHPSDVRQHPGCHVETADGQPVTHVKEDKDG